MSEADYRRKKMIVTSTQYMEEKLSFFKKHDNDYTVDTTPMDELGQYWKTYTFTDGAQWFEAMSPEYVSQEIEVKLVKVNVEVKMFRTEFWSTETGSKFYYEKF